MMKVSCNHCGSKNELGRMFCLSCGKRMQITNADLEGAVQERQAFNPLGLVKYLVVVLVLAVLAFALVPARSAVLTEQARTAARPQLTAKYGRLVQAARARSSLRESFDLAELNVFMRARQTGPVANRPDLSVTLEGDRLVVVQTIVWSPNPSVHVTFTRRAACAVSGRTLVVKGIAVGRLPLPPFMKALVTGPMADAFVLTPSEQAIEKQLVELLIKDGKLEIEVGP